MCMEGDFYFSAKQIHLDFLSEDCITNKILLQITESGRSLFLRTLLFAIMESISFLRVSGEI